MPVYAAKLKRMLAVSLVEGGGRNMSSVLTDSRGKIVIIKVKDLRSITGWPLHWRSVIGNLRFPVCNKI